MHGALLVLVELAENCNRHFENSLKEFCDIMFRHKEHKDKVVRRATLSSLPRLAALQPEMFAHDYLNTFINFVFTNLEKGKVLPFVHNIKRVVLTLLLGSASLVLGPWRPRISGWKH